MYQNSVGQPSCKNCLKGVYTPSRGHSSCKICEKGKYIDANKATGCKKCSANHYIVVDAGGTWTTDGVPERKSVRQKHDSPSDCLYCPAERGYITDLPGQAGASECKSCDPGKYSHDPTGTGNYVCRNCMTCEPGKTLMENVGGGKNGAQLPTCRENREGTCETCPQGYYKPSTGSWWTPCVFCKGGTEPNGDFTGCNYCDYENPEGARNYKPFPVHGSTFNEHLKLYSGSVVPHIQSTTHCGANTAFCYSQAESFETCENYECPERTFPNTLRTACRTLDTVQIANPSTNGIGAGRPADVSQSYWLWVIGLVVVFGCWLLVVRSWLLVCVCVVDVLVVGCWLLLLILNIVLVLSLCVRTILI